MFRFVAACSAVLFFAPARVEGHGAM